MWLQEDRGPLEKTCFSPGHEEGGPLGSQGRLPETVSASGPAGLLLPGAPSPAGFMGLWPQRLGSRISSSSGCTGSCVPALSELLGGCSSAGSSSPCGTQGLAGWLCRSQSSPRASPAAGSWSLEPGAGGKGWLAPALWSYFSSWAGWECGAFPLANDILRISLLSNYSGVSSLGSQGTSLERNLSPGLCY